MDQSTYGVSGPAVGYNDLKVTLAPEPTYIPPTDGYDENLEIPSYYEGQSDVRQTRQTQPQYQVIEERIPYTEYQVIEEQVPVQQEIIEEVYEEPIFYYNPDMQTYGQPSTQSELSFGKVMGLSNICYSCR